MMKFVLIALLSISSFAFAHSTGLASAESYRSLTNQIRPDGHFRIYMPGGVHQDVRYHLKISTPVYEKPRTIDTHLPASKHKVFREFYDRVLLDDESYMEVGGERIPLTCINISGQDNRASGADTAFYPEFIMRIYLIANDYSCEGPIRKGWPSTGGKKEAWDTYLHYEVRDPTIMLPQDVLLRYRWNEYSVVLIDEGK